VLASPFLVEELDRKPLSSSDQNNDRIAAAKSAWVSSTEGKR